MNARTWIGLAAALLACPAGTARAGEKEDIKALVDAALAAKGGEKPLNALRAAEWKSEGERPGRTTRAALAGQLPGQFRLESERTVNGKTTLFVKIINGGKGWILDGGKYRTMTREEMASVRQTFYIKHLETTLLPLRDKGLTLSHLGEARVDGKAAAGLKVSRKGLPDVSLYFDKQTMLLIKSERLVKDQATGKDVKSEQFFSDYKEAAGVKIARKVRRVVNGKEAGEVRITEFDVRRSLPDRLFLPPAEEPGANKP